VVVVVVVVVVGRLHGPRVVARHSRCRFRLEHAQTP